MHLLYFTVRLVLGCLKVISVHILQRVAKIAKIKIKH